MLIGMNPMQKLAVLTMASVLIAAAAPPLSPAGQKLFQDWKTSVDAERARQARLAPATTLAEAFARRRDLDQVGRRNLGPIFAAPLPQAEKHRLMKLVNDQITPIDEDNLRYLKSVLPADGWFRKSRDGAAVASTAWLIVQHTHDRAFQKEVLARMEPLVAEGEADGADFALLYDRNEMFEGRPQKYGSQVTCEGGVWVLSKLVDPAHVDEFRHAVGLKQTLAENEKRLGVGDPC